MYVLCTTDLYFHYLSHNFKENIAGYYRLQLKKKIIGHIFIYRQNMKDLKKDKKEIARNHRFVHVKEANQKEPNVLYRVEINSHTFHIADVSFQYIKTRVRRFRLNIFFASKRKEAK
jgi:hypothetical protein